MARRIPQHFIDDLLNRTDIVALIDARVHLRKAGHEFTALCPFHEEKTPSFTVSPSKQFYHCFGCGAHGSALNFLMEYERLEFLDAIDELAGMAGVEIPREFAPGEPAREQGSQLQTLERAAQFFRDNLRRHPRAVEYIKERGLDKAAVDEFMLGYAPGGWQNLLDHLGDERALVDAGLAVHRDDGGRCYDRFRNRVMFPIRDMRGRVIAFGGRILPGDDSGAKYLNSPETPLFHKGRQLYGLYEARQALRDLPRVLVVEGYMDVVALAQHGFRNAVATLGTATTEEHLDLLFRFTPEVLFCFDGDNAGRQAAWRALERSLPAIRDGREARFLFMPQGEDPDTLVRRQGSKAFTQLLDTATPLSRFLLDRLANQVDTSSVDGCARLVELARPHIAKLRPGAFRTLLLDQLARAVRMQRTDLERLFESGQTVAVPQARGHAPRHRVGTTPVRRALQILLEKPSLAATIGDLAELRDASLPGVALLVTIVDFLTDHPHYHTGAIIEHWRDQEAGKQLAKLASQALTIPEEGMKMELHDAVARVCASVRRQRRERLLEKAAHEDLEVGEKQELNDLLRRR